MVQLNFNAAQVKPNAALEPIPTGQYPVIITNSQEKPTKAGTGSYIELEMTIQGGDYNGRKVFDRLNIRNQNQTAVDIAYGTLSAICHVTGVMQLADTAQLHGRPFIAVVKKVPRQDQPGNFSNEVSGYKDMAGNDPGHAGTVAAPAAQPGWATPPQPAQAPQFAPQQQVAPAAPQPAYAPPATVAPAAPPAWAAGAAPQTQQPIPAQVQQPAPAYVPPAGPAGAAAAPPPWAQPTA